jgi:hypothetical protein
MNVDVNVELTHFDNKLFEDQLKVSYEIFFMEYCINCGQDEKDIL